MSSVDGSCSRERYESVPCRAGNAGSESPAACSPPGAGLRNAALCPPGRTEHVVDVSTSQPFPRPASWRRKTNSLPREPRIWGFSILQGDGELLLAGSRLACSSKPGSGGQGSLTGAGGLSAELRLQWADGQSEPPGQARQAPWRRGAQRDAVLTHASASCLFSVLGVLG